MSMTVDELIAKLQQLPPDLPVHCSDSEWGSVPVADVEIEIVNEEQYERVELEDGHYFRKLPRKKQLSAALIVGERYP